MHNEYITTCCITDERDKLLLLKYADIDITKIYRLLQPLTIELMNQHYNQVESFHNYNKEKNKKYFKIEKEVTEQLKDMLFIKKKFIEYFSQSGIKTKEDLFTYIFAFQINAYYYNNYIYSVLVEAIKKDFTEEFWDRYRLYNYELSPSSSINRHLLNQKKQKCNKGQIEINYNPPIEFLDKQIAENCISGDLIGDKLNIAKSFNIVLDNYYSEDLPMFNSPYKDSLVDLINHVKVARDFEKPKQYIKRI